MPTPYTPPETSVEPDDDDILVQGAGPLVTAAGFATMGASVLHVAASGQLVSMLWFMFAWQAAWVWSLGALGVVGTVSGMAYTQARSWAMWTSLATTVLTAVLGGAWNVYALWNGGFTLASFGAAAGSGLAATLVVVSLPRARRLARARAVLVEGT